jgi:hypothetical protein
MSLVFSRSTKKIVGMQRQARRAVFIAVRLFDTDKKATKLNRARIFTESQVCFSYAINLFISWELIPIDYGKIRVLNMTKSAKTRAENLGETVRGNPRVLVTCRLSLAQSSSEENPPTHTKSKRFQNK